MKNLGVDRLIGLIIMACVVIFPFQAYAASGHGHIRAALSTIDEIKSRSDAQPANKELGVLRGLFFSGATPKETVIKAFVRGSVVPDNLGVFIGSICDAGNFPHYGDTGLFYSQLLAEADKKADTLEDKREEYIAYALGALSHYITDKYSHPIVNEFAGGVYEEPGDHPVVEVNLDDGSINADSFFIPDEQVTTERHKFYEFWLVRHMLDMNRLDSGKLADDFNYYDLALTCDNAGAYADIIDATFTKIWGSWWNNLGITPATIKAADFSMAGFIDYVNYCYTNNIPATTMNLPIPLPKIILPTKEVSEKFQEDLLTVDDPTDNVLYSILTRKFINCLNKTAPNEIIKVLLRAAPFLEDKVLSKITLNDLKLENINLDSGKLTTKQENTARDVPEVSMELNPKKTKAYIANQAGVTLKSIEIQDSHLSSQPDVTVDSNPQAVVFDPTGRFAWVANKGANTISWVDTVKNDEGKIEEIDQNKTDNIPITRLQVGSDPVALAITPDGSKMCVANNGSRTVSIIDVAKREVKDTVAVNCEELKDIKIESQGKYAFVSVQKPGADNTHPGELQRIDLQSNAVIVLLLQNSESPGGLAISPDGSKLYTVDKGRTNNRPNYFHNFDIATNVDEPVSHRVEGSMPSRLETIDTQFYWCSVLTAPIIIDILVGINIPPSVGVYTFIGGYEDLPSMTGFLVGLPFFGLVWYDMPWMITLTYKTDPLWLRQGVNVDVPAVLKYTNYNTDFLAAYASFWYTGNIGIYDRNKKEFFAATRSIVGDDWMSRPYNRYEYLKASTIGDIIALDKYKNIAAFYPGKKIYQVLSESSETLNRKPIDYRSVWDVFLPIVSPGFIGGLNKPTGVDIQPMVYSLRPLTGETIVTMTENGAQLDYMILSHNKIVDIKVFDSPIHEPAMDLTVLYSGHIEWAQKHDRFWELIVKDTTQAPFNCALGAGVKTVNLEFEVTLDNGAVVSMRSSPEVNNLVLPPTTVNLEIEGVAENQEENKGGYIMLNSDDDNKNNIPDKDETAPVNGEDDLIKIVLHPVEPQYLAGAVTFKSLSSNSNIKVWESNTKNNEIPLSKTYSTPSDLPKELWIEGVALSQSPRDIELVLEYDDGMTIHSDSVKSTVSSLDLDIDSDNNNGINDPDRNSEEESIEDEESRCGKIVGVNQNDDNANGIPDYADFENLAESNFIPLVLEIKTPLDWTKVEIKFLYAGSPSLPADSDYAGTKIDFDDKDYKDYRAVKEGAKMRIWNISSAGAVKERSDYIVPDRVYTAADLGFTNDNEEKVFYIEGINAVEKTPIEVVYSYEGVETCREKVFVSVADVNIGVNTTNDISFNINEKDEAIEDQKDGFSFWWARDKSQGLTRADIVDLVPFKIDVPDYLRQEGFKFYLKVSSGKLNVYPAVSPEENRLQFLLGNKNSEKLVGDDIGKKQLLESSNCVSITSTPVEIPINVSGDNEFVFKAIKENTSEMTITLSLIMKEEDTNNKVEVDSVKLTLKDTRAYWWCGSTYGSKQAYTYHTEDGRTVPIDRYPDVQFVSGSRNDKKGQYLIAVHGYNNTLDAARQSYDELYRRFYWTGFRGNFIGLAWDSAEGLISLIMFDTQVQNAFQTAPAFWRFLKNTMIGEWGVPAENINVFVHSLGNLVVFDGLREYLHSGDSSGPLVNNVISYEAAIWSELFYSPEDVFYDNENSGSDNITYGVSDLKQHSWAFWLNQPDNPVTSAMDLSGGIYQSYVGDDDALAWAMRLNDAKERGWFFKDWHYYRDKLIRNPTVYRAPEGRNNLHSVVPALLMTGHRSSDYSYTDINLPSGCTPNRMANNNNIVNAIDYNWRAKSHIDYSVVDNDMWFPKISYWYRGFVKWAIERGMGLDED